jgi:hypothetical protein
MSSAAAGAWPAAARLVVRRQDLAQLGERVDVGRREDGVALAPGEGSRIGAVGGDADRRVRPLQGLRHKA